MRKSTIILLTNSSIFIISLSLGLYSNFIPLYAEKLGASYIDLGIIGVVFSLPYAFLPVLVGMLSDRVDRRPLYLGGLLGCTLTPYLLLYTSNITDIVLNRAINGIAYAFLWPTIEALLVDLTTIEERTKTMARFSLSWASGFLFGPFFGSLIMAATSNNYLILFSIGFGVAISAIVIASYASLGYKRVGSIKASVKEKSNSFSFSIFLPILLSIFMYSVALGLLISIFPAYEVSLGVSVPVVGILFSLFGAIRLATFLFIHRIVRVGVRHTFILALAFQVIALTSVALLRNFLSLVVFHVLFGLAMGILSPLTLSMASKIAPKDKIGLALGLTEATFGIGMTVGPFVGGVTAQLISPETPYLVTAITTLLVAILIYLGKKIDKEN